MNNLYVVFVKWNTCLKKIVSKKFIKEYEWWEHINNLERFYVFQNSHRRCSVKKGAPKNFANFTGKHLCLSLLLIKLQVSKPTIKRRLQHSFLVFRCKACVYNKLLHVLESALYFNHGFTQTFLFRTLPEVFFSSF